MSVGKNSFGLAPYYDWKLHEGYALNLSATEYICGAAGTSIAVVAGNVQTPTGTSFIMQYTENGISWSSITSSPNTAIHSMAYGNGVFVAVGASGAIYSANESAIQTWTARTKAGSSANNFARVQWIQETGRFYAWQTTNERVQYSSDGITWSLGGPNFNPSITPAPPSNTQSDNTGIAYVNGMHILFTGATASTTSTRFYAFKDISVNSYSEATGTSWLGFPTNMGNNEWYIASNQSNSFLAAKIGWGTMSAVGQAVVGPASMNGNDLPFIPSPETTSATSNPEYFQFSVSQNNSIEIYKTDGYTQIVGAVTHSAARWNVTQFGIGHQLYPDRDISSVSMRREFIASSQIGSLADACKRFAYRIRFSFRGNQYLIFGKVSSSAITGGAHRILMLRGTRAFRPIRTTTDFRY